MGNIVNAATAAGHITHDISSVAETRRQYDTTQAAMKEYDKEKAAHPNQSSTVSFLKAATRDNDAQRAIRKAQWKIFKRSVIAALCIGFIFALIAWHYFHAKFKTGVVIMFIVGFLSLLGTIPFFTFISDIEKLREP
jgi:Flp pilus assembly protein TadB